MADAMFSRARMHDLARLGRFRPPSAGEAGLRRACASRRRAGPDAESIATIPSTRPRAASSRPAASEPMASSI